MRARTILGKNSEAAMSLSKRLRQLGQGMTEYIIIVALIAIAAISVYGLFGDTIREQMGIMTEELAGKDSTIKADAADGAKTASKEVGLSNFKDGAKGK